MTMRLPVLLTLPLLLCACAATEPFPPAPTEVLVVVNGTAHTLTVVPTGAPSAPLTIPLGATATTPGGIAARQGVALVPLGDDDAVAVVDLAAGSVVHTWPLLSGSGAVGAAIVDDSIGYVALPAADRVIRINYLTGDTATVAVGTRPVGLVFTRGRLFVLNSNTDAADSALGP